MMERKKTRKRYKEMTITTWIKCEGGIRKDQKNEWGLKGRGEKRCYKKRLRKRLQKKKNDGEHLRRIKGKNCENKLK